MQKIFTREEQVKKTKMNQLLIGIVLILLMALSTIGYALSTREKEGETNKIKYNGVEFIKNSEYWQFNFNGRDFITRYNPQETENVSINFIYLRAGDFSNEALYFVGDYPEASMELKRNIYPFALRIQDACLKELNCSLNSLPVKNCSSDNIIIIKEPIKGDKERINQEDKCIFINANIENQTIYADAFLFKILGIR